ncbi:MAG: hypothetical protein HY271_10050 [Deltaproteobacteria bacterium]|nr:hypothetical protein [Deltaproteobacteria bacterium]
MTKTASILEHLTSEQLKALLALAAGAGPLADILPAGVAESDQLARLLGEMCPGEPEAGQVLLDTVAAAGAPVAALRGVKEMAKELVAGVADDAHRQAAMLLYHAAVAAAFGTHGVDLSSRPVAARRTLWQELAAALAAHPLGRVFRNAAERVP